MVISSDRTSSPICLLIHPYTNPRHSGHASTSARDSTTLARSVLDTLYNGRQSLLCGRIPLTRRSDPTCFMHLSFLRYAPRTGISHLVKTSRIPHPRDLTLTGIQAATMATAHQIQIPPTDSGLLRFDHDSKTASEVTALLQKDLEVRKKQALPSPIHLRPIRLTCITLLSYSKEPSCLLQHFRFP